MRHVNHAQFAAIGEIVEAPAQRACEDQNFGLPTGIYVAMAMMFAGSVAVLSLAFSEQMGVSFGVILAFLGMFFAVPSLFPRMAGGKRAAAAEWRAFLENGIDTATGRASAASAIALVLLLPALVFCFAVAIVAIAASI